MAQSQLTCSRPEGFSLGPVHPALTMTFSNQTLEEGVTLHLCMSGNSLSLDVLRTPPPPPPTVAIVTSRAKKAAEKEAKAKKQKAPKPTKKPKPPKPTKKPKAPKPTKKPKAPKPTKKTKATTTAPPQTQHPSLKEEEERLLMELGWDTLIRPPTPKAPGWVEPVEPGLDRKPIKPLTEPDVDYWDARHEVPGGDRRKHTTTTEVIMFIPEETTTVPYIGPWYEEYDYADRTSESELV
ncbi:hypothetical protein INR49_019730 [Caranx melampygus]|nr:hypothetical protein INR49_019730 [Caranx melampygus]